MANTWVYPSEVLPLALRTRGSAITACASWAATFLVVEITPPGKRITACMSKGVSLRTLHFAGIASMHQYFYLLYVGANYIMAACVYFFYPETQGLSLEAVDVIFTGDYVNWNGAVKKSLRLRQARRRGDVKLEDLHLSNNGAVQDTMTTEPNKSAMEKGTSQVA
jgi:hypothetical protein